MVEGSTGSKRDVRMDVAKRKERREVTGYGIKTREMIREEKRRGIRQLQSWAGRAIARENR
jgi:hypothetical protein